MDLEILAQHIRMLRNAKRMSQQGLAAAAGLSVPAIRNLEAAKNKPRIGTLQLIARALDVKLQDLFVPVRPLRNVRFRSTKRMLSRENILADISRRLDDFNYLEEVLGEPTGFRLKDVRSRCSAETRESIIHSASLCRKELGLKDTEPIHDICGLLESAGVKVFPLEMASEGFFGLSVGEEDGGPAVVVNAWERIPVERRIFSAAHELGHLLLHLDAFDVNQTEEEKEEEKQADLFAGILLMPDEGFRKEWGEAAGLHWVDRVFKVKRIFHVSYKTVLRRLIDYGHADASIWMKFNSAYQRRFNRKLSFKEEPAGAEGAEPFGLQGFDFYEDRLSRLTRKAVEQDKISISRGAEILRISIEEMQDLINDWKGIQ